MKHAANFNKRLTFPRDETVFFSVYISILPVLRADGIQSPGKAETCHFLQSSQKSCFCGTLDLSAALCIWSGDRRGIPGGARIKRHRRVGLFYHDGGQLQTGSFWEATGDWEAREDMSMNIRIAGRPDYTEVMSFYDAMCRELGKRAFLHAGNQGGYPSADMVRAAIHERGLIIGEEQGMIITAIILNHDADPAYDNVKWRIEARPEQVMIMHALRVSPEFSGRGYGKRMVDYCIARAKNTGLKAIRLDTLDENTIAQKLYLSMGFSFVDTVEIEYKDIGEPRILYCYELVL